MGLDAVLRAAEQRRKSLQVYEPGGTDIADQFATRNVRVEHRELPPSGPEPFLIVREDGQFRGAIALEDLRELIDPPIRRPWDLDVLAPGYRAVFELFDDTVFRSLDRSQLLATSRELEDRAWRTGRGQLHVGFQSTAAFRAQEPVYRRLAAETDLDVHVYAVDAPTDQTTVQSPTFHAEPAATVGRFWFLVFDGGGDRSRTFALVADQSDGDSFEGVWTYDPAIVDRAFEALE